MPKSYKERFLALGESDQEKNRISPWLENLAQEKGEAWVSDNQNLLLKELEYILNELGLPQNPMNSD